MFKSKWGSFVIWGARIGSEEIPGPLKVYSEFCVSLHFSRKRVHSFHHIIKGSVTTKRLGSVAHHGSVLPGRDALLPLQESPVQPWLARPEWNRQQQAVPWANSTPRKLEGGFCFLVTLEDAILPKLSQHQLEEAGTPPYCPQLPSPVWVGGDGVSRYPGPGFTTLKATLLSGTASDSDWQLHEETSVHRREKALDNLFLFGFLILNR